MKILSNKKNQITLEKWNYIVKIIDFNLFQKLNNLQLYCKLNIIFFEKYFIKNEKYFLYYKKYEKHPFFEYIIKNDINFQDFEKFIDLVIKKLFILNFSYKNKENLFLWFTHNDPQPQNLVIKDWEIYFIDLESINFEYIIFQPFYLFCISFLELSSELEYKKSFEIIFKRFFNNTIYKQDFNYIWFEKYIKLCLKKLDFNYHIDRKIYFFIIKNIKNLQNLFEEMQRL